MAFFKNILSSKKGEPKKPAQGERAPETRQVSPEKSSGEPQGEARAPGKYSGGVLLSPMVTEKSSIGGALNNYTFKVTTATTKSEVKKAIEKKYGVRVQRVNIANMPSKKVRLGRSIGHVPGYKKAMVTLEPGERIEIGV